MEPVGQRIARARRRRGLSQAALAGLVGRSESWLSQVERGKRGVDSHAVLTRLASILRVDIAEISENSADVAHVPNPYPHAARIEQAMMDHHARCASITGEDAERVQSVVHLHEMTRAAYREYQNANMMGTAFGPVNVAIHTVSTSLRFGDARTAAEIGESLDTDAIPVGLVGRRAARRIRPSGPELTIRHNVGFWQAAGTSSGFVVMPGMLSRRACV
jgi:transcriptional regulator with XRE-family HTH domain